LSRGYNYLKFAGLECLGNINCKLLRNTDE
jgi:hypothetical protein